MSLGNKEVMSNNLKYYMNKKGVDRNQLCSDLDLKYMTVSDWINAKTYPRIDKIELLANYFGINKSDLIEEKSTIPSATPTEAPKTVSDDVLRLDRDLYPNNHKSWIRYGNALLDGQNTVVDSKNTVNEPLYEYNVYEKLSAGTGFSYTNDGNYDTVYYNQDLDHDFASWVFGDSMEPRFPNGSVALIKQTGFDYDGAIYAIDWAGQTYLKKVYREKDGLRLVSLNPKYSDLFAPYTEDPRIIGKVVGNFMPEV
ncbi:MAG: XRE family transcriptional regulator [Streptococcus orisratti]|uniref:XRE family transcriptional regulator n=1 Tax=Streptococcus orisratti TaxID=114652 RepID=UPI002355E84E|nr:XRE family transcriptional regulator [Streptococcus orisratti]MCI7677881.1 XRE family transcriptional regulator [Streptococcus orisratti]MDY5634822.1 XRE family transcriptional regulator [Streptococcus orisratti]